MGRKAIVHLATVSVALVAWAGTTAGCRREAPADPAAEGGIAVTVQEVVVGNLVDALTTSGTVVPAASGDWTVLAPEAAHITELTKAEGAAVVQGDVLVKFDVATITRELTARQAAVADATTRLEAATREVERLNGLAARGLVPRQAMDAAKGEMVDARTALTEAQSLLNSVQPFLERTVIKARFDGIVLKVWHKEGDFVTGEPTDPVLRVIDPTRSQVSLPLSAAELARVNAGQLVTLRVAGQPAAAGTVVSRPLLPDPTSGRGDVRVAFAAPIPVPLDTLVEADIVLESRTSVVIAPRVAIRRGEDGAYVFLAGADRRAARRDVRVGLTTSDAAEIVSGLAPGDRVIVTGFDQLADGALIVIGG